MVGKHVLVGLTYVDEHEELIRKEQKHGVIVEANESSVWVRAVASDEEFSLPPDLEAFEPAPEGKYTLRGSGEVVNDPDLLVSWTIRPEAGS
jgi:hypothetical protein